MICLQLCNYTWPQFVLLCQEGIAEVHFFLINWMNVAQKRNPMGRCIGLSLNSESTDPTWAPTCDICRLIIVHVCWFLKIASTHFCHKWTWTLCACFTFPLDCISLSAGSKWKATSQAFFFCRGCWHKSREKQRLQYENSRIDWHNVT